ncbi:MAG: MmgE/PrpD family protein [Clostridia bacterium]|nr:MmgE/PrpD family protein [Clostridia bacterium]
MNDNTKILSEFSARLTYEDLTPRTIENTRLFFIDYIAAACAGYKVNTVFNRAVEELVFRSGGTLKESSVLFCEEKTTCEKAAFLNACYAHGADMDDGNRKAMGHVGVHVFSAVLALAEKLKASERDVIVAINVGYEVYCRIAAAVQPNLVHRGFHSTGTAGTVACAAAAAKLLHMDADGIYNAMAISVTLSSGLVIVGDSGQSIKPLNPAKAAENGIIAAMLTQKGVKGPVYPLDSQHGWFHAMSDSVDESMITDGLGEKFCIDECYAKPYPACRHTHCGIQAALELREENAITPDMVESVKIHIYSNAIRLAGQIKKPKSIDDSKFSIHYATACILAAGKFALEDLDYTKAPQAVWDIIDRTELIADETMENRDKGIRGCMVEICLADKKKVSKTVLIPKGDPQNPFTISDVCEKLAQCASGLISDDRRDKLIAFLKGFGRENVSFEGICEK